MTDPTQEEIALELIEKTKGDYQELLRLSSFAIECLALTALTATPNISAGYLRRPELHQEYSSRSPRSLLSEVLAVYSGDRHPQEGDASPGDK